MFHRLRSSWMLVSYSQLHSGLSRRWPKARGGRSDFRVTESTPAETALTSTHISSASSSSSSTRGLPQALAAEAVQNLYILDDTIKAADVQQHKLADQLVCLLLGAAVCNVPVCTNSTPSTRNIRQPIRETTTQVPFQVTLHQATDAAANNLIRLKEELGLKVEHGFSGGSQAVEAVKKAARGVPPVRSETLRRKSLLSSSRQKPPVNREAGTPPKKSSATAPDRPADEKELHTAQHMSKAQQTQHKHVVTYARGEKVENPKVYELASETARQAVALVREADALQIDGLERLRKQAEKAAFAISYKMRRLARAAPTSSS